MKKNMMLKKMLKGTLFLALSLMMMSADAKVRGDKSAGTTSSSVRRTARGAQRRSPQGRFAANTRQKPVKKTTEQIVPTEAPSKLVTGGPSAPVIVQGKQQPVPTSADTNRAKWVAIKKILLKKKESPSEALAIVKKIRAKRLTDEQEEWLDMFEGWMVLAMLQKSGQLIGTDSAAKIGQQGTLLAQSTAQVSESIDAQKWEQIQNFLNEKVKAGLSSQALEYVKYIKEKYIQEKPFMFTSEQQKWLNDFEQNVKRSEAALQQVSPVIPKKTFLGIPISNAPASESMVTEIDPVTGLPKSQPISVEPSVSAQPQRQGPLQQWWNDPNKTFLGIPVSNASKSQQPATISPVGGGPSVKVEEPKPVAQVPVTQPKQQGALQKAWAEAPSPSNILYYIGTGGMGQPALSGSTAQAPVIQPQPGTHATEEGWKKLQENLMKEAENPSQKLVDRIEEIKKYEYFNDEQRKWLNEFQRLLKTLFVSEEDWKKVKIGLAKASITWKPEALMERIEKIKKDYVLNNEQRKWLEQFQNQHQPLSVPVEPLVQPIKPSFNE